MKTNPLKKGTVMENSAPIGTVTREMVGKRAAELAVINGRSPREVLESDWAEARRELTGSLEDPKETLIESIPESERWDPVPGSVGGKVPVAQSEDEDDEGRSDSQRLVEEGVAEAEHDQMRKATKRQSEEI
jgi:hypothetical protein